ncbi:hypothetical protein NLJ89_g10572 [Agrocybe chaxingu]|uniref:Retrotransposon gag domain-containing protein n=1 Tax=Agrocybe chaxingu TaxID=84603 RepID=A0A9W8MNT2_9AGAR|nr:hypothetical protein NLJ89_g10572 [Agrocybe chaxingu]
MSYSDANLDQTSWVPPGNTSEGVPTTSSTDTFTLPPYSNEEERLVIQRALFGLGHNFESFSRRHLEESQATSQVLTALANQIIHLSNALAPAPPPPKAVASTSAPRVCEPRMYDGSPSQVDPFVREISNSLFLQRHCISTDREKCLYFGFYLKDGPPSAWYAAIEKHNPMLFDDYDAFLNAFKKHFEDSDRKGTALTKLRKLVQTGPASTYAAQFQQYSWELDLTEETSIEMFYTGLKDEVKDTLTYAFLENKPTKFDQYVTKVIDIDNKLHRRVVERKDGSSKSPSKGSSSFSSSKPFQSVFVPASPVSPPVASTSFTTPSSSSNGVAPMEIDSVKRGPLSKAERAYRAKNGLCFYCRQGMHSIADCPNMSPKKKKQFKSNKGKNASGKA